MSHRRHTPAIWPKANSHRSIDMKNNTFAKTVARIALPLAIGDAALGMAGIANAQT